MSGDRLPPTPRHMPGFKPHNQIQPQTDIGWLAMTATWWQVIVPP
jgi:hypothetical protein